MNPSEKNSQTEAPQRELEQYVKTYGGNDSEVLEEITEVTRKHRGSRMMAGYDTSRLIRVQLKLLNAKKCLEIGVFTGYNAASMASTLPEGGKVYALDVSEEYISIARPIWEKHGLSDKINVIIGPAVDSLDKILSNGEAGTFDFAFIDADKKNYDAYYEKCLQLLRPGGLIGVDNVIWSGRVAHDESKHDESTSALHTLNKKIKGDSRVDYVLLNISDGFTLCRKK